MSFDPNAYRDSSLEGWQEAAPGWIRRQEVLRDFGAPVSHWMLDTLALAPGQRVLELAAGMGETGMLAAELVAPTGGVIISDQAEAMLEGARARAVALALSNVEFQVLNAEWIDLPVASVDAAVCRWGYMLMADPAVALRETRRVLRPGGRVALAVWDEVQRNPWAELPALELGERGLLDPPPEGPPRPGPFALGNRERVIALLEEAGFAEIEVRAMDLWRRHASFDELWEVTLDLSRSFHDAVMDRPSPEVAQIKAALAERFAPFTDARGALEVPGRTLLAAAAA